MTDSETQFERLLERLSVSEVEFVVIGGLAANLLGAATVTFDVDICYERSPTNIAKLVRALRGVNAELRVAGETEGHGLPFVLDKKSLQWGENFTFQTDLGPLDCLAFPAGSEGYEQLIARAQSASLGTVEVKVASIDDLLAMKRKAGRPKDVSAILELEEIKRIQAEQR